MLPAAEENPHTPVENDDRHDREDQSGHSHRNTLARRSWLRRQCAGLQQPLEFAVEEHRQRGVLGTPALTVAFVVADGQHRRHRAHAWYFHAVYQDSKAVFALDPIECIGGALPRTQQRLVEAWAEIHREELLQDWALLQCGKPPLKIESLR